MKSGIKPPHRGVWAVYQTDGVFTPVTIGFYGGEPCLNMRLITKIVDYVNQQDSMGKKFFFNMTTNAMLLDRYADYLVEHKFRLLISLDGDKNGQAYRVDANGANSFNRVYRNIEFLKNRHPEYFDKYVMFNSVLHNKNSVETIYYFIRDKFGKEPSISPLNNSGVNPDKIEEFKKTYKNINDSIENATDCETLKHELFVKNPMTSQVLDFIYYSTGNVYANYNSLFISKKQSPITMTGTCTPFSKKMFVTVNGKILQCERIHHNYALGNVNCNGVNLDFEYAANQYNTLTHKLAKQCLSCANSHCCKQCVYQLDDLLDNITVCRGYTSEAQKASIDYGIQKYLREHPELYKRLLNDVVIR